MRKNYPPKLKVILLLGYPRSGSTVLGELINKLPNFIHVGELERLWYLQKNKPANLPQVICSCGEHLWNCNFWKTHVKKLSSKLEEINERENLKMNNRILVSINKELIEKGKLNTKEVKLYTEIFYSLFSSLGSENKIILDTSKELWYAKYMESTGLFDLTYIHLVRDLGGVILSRQKKMKRNDGNSDKVKLNYKYLFYDSLRWNWLNYQISNFLKDKRKIEVNYIDFLNNPILQLEKVGSLVEQEIDTTIINDSNEFIINENHIIHGNRFRFTRGVVKLKEDVRWKFQIKEKDKSLLKRLSLFQFSKKSNFVQEPSPVNTGK